MHAQCLVSMHADQSYTGVHHYCLLSMDDEAHARDIGVIQTHHLTESLRVYRFSCEVWLMHISVHSCNVCFSACAVMSCGAQGTSLSAVSGLAVDTTSNSIMAVTSTAGLTIGDNSPRAPPLHAAGSIATVMKLAIADGARKWLYTVPGGAALTAIAVTSAGDPVIAGCTADNQVQLPVLVMYVCVRQTVCCACVI